jgi:hypothetical protein
MGKQRQVQRNIAGDTVIPNFGNAVNCLITKLLTEGFEFERNMRILRHDVGVYIA